MRRLIARVLGPIFHAVVDHFDPNVERDEHMAFAAALCRDGILAAGGDLEHATDVCGACCSRLGLPDPHLKTHDDPDSDRDPSFESCLETETALAWAQVSLLTDSPLPAARPPIAHASIDWEQDSASGRRLSRQLLQRLSNNDGYDPTLLDVIEPLMAGLSERHWFLLKRGTLYGTGDFLRALLSLIESAPTGQAEHLRAYARCVLDRLIRHLEVKREDALSFSTSSLPHNADPTLERIRFSLVLLQASRVFADLRYLNTALKTIDWHLTRLRARHATSSLLDPAALHYLACLAEQETRMAEVFA